MKRPVKRHLVLRLLAPAVLVCVAAACRQRDMRTTTVKVPQVTNAVCEARVRAALRDLRGVEHDELRFDHAAGTLSVRYDSMQLGLKNIEHAIAAAGFDANDLPADPAARAALPAVCGGATARPAPDGTAAGVTNTPAP